jgi:hypothetical protein
MKAQIVKWGGDYPPPFSKRFYVYKDVDEQDWELGFPKCLYLLNNGQWSPSALPDQGGGTPLDESKPHAYYSTIEEAMGILEKIGELYEIEGNNA